MTAIRVTLTTLSGEFLSSFEVSTAQPPPKAKQATLERIVEGMHLAKAKEIILKARAQKMD